MSQKHQNEEKDVFFNKNAEIFSAAEASPPHPQFTVWFNQNMLIF